MLLALLPTIALRAAAMAASGPVTVPAAMAVPAVAAATASASASPPTVMVILHDVNHGDRVDLDIGLDGSVDEPTADRLAKLMRCKRTDQQHRIEPATLAMLAAVAQRYPGQSIEIVSAFRMAKKDSSGSKHRLGAAIDFRVEGASSIEIRDSLWTTFRGVGNGWYPGEEFIHMGMVPKP